MSYKFQNHYAIRFILSPPAQNQIFHPHFPTVFCTFFFKYILEEISFNPLFQSFQSYSAIFIYLLLYNYVYMYVFIYLLSLLYPFISLYVGTAFCCNLLIQPTGISPNHHYAAVHVGWQLTDSSFTIA
jgi:hypothetical protein